MLVTLMTGSVFRQERLRKDLCEWLQWLQQHIGFNGWRFDFVKGYAGDAVKVHIACAIGAEPIRCTRVCSLALVGS